MGYKEGNIERAAIEMPKSDRVERPLTSPSKYCQIAVTLTVKGHRLNKAAVYNGAWWVAKENGDENWPMRIYSVMVASLEVGDSESPHGA